ncbi:MinD/ParA family protein [Pseudobacteriovorax antillogorgiicola]|uniref:Flagellar biosynthesis protein FlhG n=1 Tax=Pseudobacteriovorax antillogorgiicola TaxID=1513793 RepID=A0A1Y6CP31_9BACT|nr:MinD/ParA family protein [Pseudobacteriovorax antillogorgiicola]TCS46654.1 flagellar biosynthesis protein FlhG [Pseudobacteriovorax antillogorgiicola]SMF66416.1 flagellar biosynthesis protein FlhG [Pseudobacteriovorax antillogorgiicola]
MKRKSISVASGKGGVGKTITTVQLALSTRRQNRRVLILDGDLGMANVDVVLGLRPRYNINDVIDGKVGLQDIILQGPMGIHLIPSGSGFANLANLPLAQRVSILDQLDDISKHFDVILIDTGAGISETVIHLNSISDEVVVVTTPEPHAMTDAYAFIKVMAEKYQEKRINLLINQAVNQEHGLKIGRRITEVAKRFLDTDIVIIGVVPYDDLVPRTIMNQAAGSDLTAHTRSGQAWNEIALKLFETMRDVEKSHWEPLLFPNEVCSQRI